MTRTRLFWLALIGTVAATQAAWSSPLCTVGSVQGTYAFQADGLVLVPGTPITGPFMRQGSFTADGMGGITFSTLAVYNGLNFGVEHFGGTYTVTSDCTIALNVQIPAPILAGATFKGRVANDGEDVMFMLTSTQNPQAPAITTVLGHGRKQTVSACSAKTLSGAYRFEVNGSFNLPPVGTETAVRLVGQVQTVGTSGLSASFVESIGGTIGEESNTGTYTVSPDCTFALSFSVAGSPIVIRGSFIGSGAEAFLALNPDGQVVMVPPFGNVTVNGVVATGTLLQQSSSSASPQVTTASAGPKNVTVLTRELALDGTASISADGRPLSYQWSIPMGSPPAAILQANTATPTVLFGSGRGVYSFQLTVTDSTGVSASDVAAVTFLGN